MRIGLIDVDGHAKKKKWGATIYPNIALCKISRFHKEHGDIVEWYSHLSELPYDWVYMSKVFSFSSDYPYIINNCLKLIKGGTGYIVGQEDLGDYKPQLSDRILYWATLPKEIDLCQPDYSIYPNIPKHYAYGFLTRGCPNRCKWCVVPKKEGNIRKYMDVEEIAIEGRYKLVLMDNNFLAAGDYAHEQLDKIIANGYRVDFNQALDARLVTDDFAKQLAKVKWLDRNRIRFGCDTKAQIGECEHAMSLIDSYGFNGEYFLYTMLNDDFKECYERVSYWWNKLQETRRTKVGNWVYAYAQPYRDPYNRHQIIPQWQKDMANFVNKKAHFVAHSFEDFMPRKGFHCREYLKELL